MTSWLDLTGKCRQTARQILRTFATPKEFFNIAKSLEKDTSIL